jgi:alkylation response protein AidB-like acyl-CoA dehydrogenase
LELTEEHEMFRESLHGFLEREVEPRLEKRDDGPMSGDEARQILGGLHDLGLGYDEGTASGWLGDLRFYAVASDEISRVWPSLTMTLNAAAPAIFVRFASQATREAMEPKLAEGACIGCLGVTEPGGGSDSSDPDTTARRDGDEWVLDGEKTWVSNATVADVALVLARNEESGDLDLWLVDRETSPFGSREQPKLGWRASPTGTLVFEGCRVPEANRLPTMLSNALAEGRDLTEAVPWPEGIVELFMGGNPMHVMFSFMRTGMAFMAVGIMEACLEASLDYATQRETFGEPIGAKQLVQERLYGMKADLESSRLLAEEAVDLLHAGDPGSRLASSLAKGKACERCVDVADHAVQIHGATGLSTEHPVERYHRDARMMTIPDGTTEIQKLVVGKELTGLSGY